ncbi:MAG: hypothetical protein GX589_05985 [Deltaproteobacteria bacterium]|nr:hypothetical protein [Deltaproteobacteria bacterium]
MQNNRLAALGMAEADKNRLGMTLEFVSNVRAQDRDLGEPITEPAQAERVIGSVAKQVLENSDLALAASANQSFKNVVSLLINVDTSPAKT